MLLKQLDGGGLPGFCADNADVHPVGLQAFPEALGAAAGGEDRHAVEEGRDRSHHRRVAECRPGFLHDRRDFFLDVRRGGVHIGIEVVRREEWRRFFGHRDGHRARYAGDQNIRVRDEFADACRRKGADIGGMTADHLCVGRRLLHPVGEMDLRESGLAEPLRKTVPRTPETDESELHPVPPAVTSGPPCRAAPFPSGVPPNGRDCKFRRYRARQGARSPPIG